MARYTYRTIDVQSNAVLEDIDLQDVQFNVKLSAVGDLSGSLFVPQNKRGLLLDDATFPGRTGIYAMRNGEPVWGGIIWKRDWDEQSSTFKLSCGSWESYAYHIMQLNTLSYDNVEQFQIARDVLARNGVQVESGITWPTTGASGVLRRRNLFSYEYKSVGLELEQLAGLENGFDYTVESYVKSDGSFGRRYKFGYPKLGRTASLNPASNSLTFDYPGNLSPFSLVEDAESGATSLFAIGSGEGQAMLVAHAGDGSLGTGAVPLQTQAASAILARLNANGSVVVGTWTWSGAPSYVITYGPYLEDLAEKDSVSAVQATTSTTGAVPEPTQAAQLILARMNDGLAMNENWTWAGAPAIVDKYNESLQSAFKAQGGSIFDTAASKAWLQEYIRTHPARTTTTTTGTVDWAPVKTWLQSYINAHPAPYTFNPTPDTAYGPWPRLDTTSSHKSVLFPTTLQQHANEDLAGKLPPIDSWTFQLAPDSDVKLTDIQIGDSAVFRLTSRRWREPKIMIRRITQITVKPGDQGTLEVVQLGLSDERS